MQKKPILEIDARGWSRLQGNLPRHRLFWELFQNSKDEDGTTRIDIRLTPLPGRPAIQFAVEDDGPGFADIRHAYTLFAPSAKLGAPTKSGFMNVGEKCVVVGCLRLDVETVTGTVRFDMEDQSRQEFPRRKRDRGTLVGGVMRMTREELNETMLAIGRLIVPAHITLTVNGRVVPHRTPLRAFPARLPTRVLDDNGDLVTRTRDTTLEVYALREGETPTLYELGIPVVDHDIRQYHVNVAQKVILNKDRDNVTPAYMQSVRVLVLNHTTDLLTGDAASDDWVRAAAGDERAEEPAVRRVFDLRFGEQRAVASVTDQESNYRATSEGYKVIHSRELSEGERSKLKQFGLAEVAHDLFPTPKPYSDDPDAPPVELIPEAEYTTGMRNTVAYARFLARELMGCVVTVRIVKAPNFRACYGGRCLDLSYRTLGRAWFNRITEDTDALLIHEFGHEYEGNHLSENYHRALCRLAAKLKRLALDKPESLRPFLGERLEDLP